MLFFYSSNGQKHILYSKSYLLKRFSCLLYVYYFNIFFPHCAISAMTSLMEGNIPYEWKRLFIWSAWRPQLWIWYHPMEADTRFFGCARHRSSLQYRAREPVFYLTGNKTCSQQSDSKYFPPLASYLIFPIFIHGYYFQVIYSPC